MLAQWKNVIRNRCGAWVVVGKVGAGSVGSCALYATGCFTEAQAEDISFPWLLDAATGIFHYVTTTGNWFAVGG